MRHGTHTLVISTTEQADAMLEHLAECEKAARADDYATERARPIKWLSCTCCGESLQGRDWWNQEPGYGLCDRCATRYCDAKQPGDYSQTYGVNGIHYLVPQAETDNPPLVVNRGQSLYGLDERLRIEYDGYVYWKGIQIEHFSGSLMEDSEESKATARELIRRCETLEARGDVVNCTNVIWKWEG